MDWRLLEFWGNLLLNAAKGQKQMDDMAEMLRKSYSGFEGMLDLFQKVYGLDPATRSNPSYLDVWNKAETDFRKSYKDFLALMGGVPRDEHQALLQQNEELKKKVASQGEMIKHLQNLFLQTKGIGAGYEEMTRQFVELVKEQGDQFKSFMENYGRLFKAPSAPCKDREE